MAKYVELEPGESVLIGDKTVVTFTTKTGRKARLRIDSPHLSERISPADTARVLTRSGPTAAPTSPQPILRRTPPEE